MKGKIMIWSDLTDAQQKSILQRNANGESVDDLAAEYGLISSSLGRKIRLIRSAANNVRSYMRIKLPLRIEEHTRVLIYTDLHAGAEDESATRCAISIAREWQPQVIFNLGDTLDEHVLSTFNKDPSAPTLEDERMVWKNFSQSMDAVIEKPAKKYIVRGNHDLRFETWLRNQGAMISSMHEMTLDGLLMTKELGWEPIVDEILVNPRGDDLYPDPELLLTHGSKARTHAGTSVRATSDMYGGTSTIVGHAHRSAMVAKRSSRGIIRNYEVGTLADFDVEYAEFPDWSQSILVGYI
jgi:predicted phosphodiesterase